MLQTFQMALIHVLYRLHKPKPASKPGPKSYTESETSENVDDEIMAELEELMGPATTEGGSPIGVPKSG